MENLSRPFVVIIYMELINIAKNREICFLDDSDYNLQSQKPTKAGLSCMLSAPGSYEALPRSALELKGGKDLDPGLYSSIYPSSY